MFTVVEFQAKDEENIWDFVKCHETSFFVKGNAIEILNWINYKCTKCLGILNINNSKQDDKCKYLLFCLENNEKRRRVWAEITGSGLAAVRVVQGLDDFMKKMDAKCSKCNNTRQASAIGSFIEHIKEEETDAPQSTQMISYRDFGQAQQMVTSTPMHNTYQGRTEPSLPLTNLSSLMNQSNITEVDSSAVASDLSLPVEAENMYSPVLKSARKSFKGYITKASLTCKKCSKVVRCRSIDGKDYKAKACMLSHLKVHTPTVPFQCNLCDYAVRYHNVMKAHMDKRHPDENINYTNLSNSLQYAEETIALTAECFPDWDFSN